MAEWEAGRHIKIIVLLRLLLHCDEQSSLHSYRVFIRKGRSNQRGCVNPSSLNLKILLAREDVTHATDGNVTLQEKSLLRRILIFPHLVCPPPSCLLRQEALIYVCTSGSVHCTV